jgi:hypothetical protein
MLAIVNSAAINVEEQVSQLYIFLNFLLQHFIVFIVDVFHILSLFLSILFFEAIVNGTIFLIFILCLSVGV